MADTKISALPAGTAIAGTEVVPGVQSAATVKFTFAQILTYIRTVILGANPSASAGLAAVNGSATTFMRSDAAPAISQGIVPTWTGAHVFSVNGAASTPGLSVTGIPFAGTGTTSTPQMFTQSSNATTATNWNVSGTLIGGNAHTGIGALLDLKVDGVSTLTASASGGLTISGTMVVGGANQLTFSGRGNLTSPGANQIQVGPTDAAAPAAQMLSAQSVIAGTSNTAGVLFTLALSKSTGTGLGGGLAVTGTLASTTGSTQNTATTWFSIVAGAPKLPVYTVATLPSASVVGQGGLAFVSDASTTVVLGNGTAVVGGGANKVPVYSDGTTWLIG